MTLRCYLAAPFKWGSRLDAEIAPQLRDAGIDVVSRWHRDHRGQSEGAMSMRERGEILRDNLDDLYRADVVIACEFDRSGREFYLEIGRALERCVPVYYVPHDWDAPFLSAADINVTMCDSFHTALVCIAGAAARATENTNAARGA